jgi:hypothetical protein
VALPFVWTQRPENVCGDATKRRLGVEQELVTREYLLTDEQPVPALEPIFERFTAAGSDRAVLLPVLGELASCLEASFEELQRRFGTSEGYFADALGIDVRARRRCVKRYSRRRPRAPSARRKSPRSPGGWQRAPRGTC